MGVNTKEKILSAAEKLFMENDHEDVSVRRICAAAGVSNGSFYHHIGSKENLIKMIYYSSDEMGIKIFLQKSKYALSRYAPSFHRCWAKLCF